MSVVRSVNNGPRSYLGNALRSIRGGGKDTLDIVVDTYLA
jgi:hypothetical protein